MDKKEGNATSLLMVSVTRLDSELCAINEALKKGTFDSLPLKEMEAYVNGLRNARMCAANVLRTLGCKSIPPMPEFKIQV